MTHEIDMCKTNKKAVGDLARAHKWHNELNRRLKNIHHKPESMFDDAIRESKKHKLIGEKTARKADDIRIKGNEARHVYK